MNMLMLIRKIVMVCSNLFTICSLGGQRSPIAYPGRDPRFHMTKLNWIQTPSFAKVCSWLQPQQQLHVTPIRTMRPRFQFWWKSQLDFNENVLIKKVHWFRLVCTSLAGMIKLPVFYRLSLTGHLTTHVIDLKCSQARSRPSNWKGKHRMDLMPISKVAIFCLACIRPQWKA